MVSCEWASMLTRYDCRKLRTVHGADCLEIGTPFSLPDGSAINLYITTQSAEHLIISDNGDTLLQLSSMGIDVWNGARLRGLREAISREKIALDSRGDFRMVARTGDAPIAFAQAITGLLAVSRWASEQLKFEPVERDLAAEAEPYIIARAPDAEFVRNPRAKGASRAEHVFDYRHGYDLIDVIAPTPQSTGGVMRKVGDVINGPFADPYTPLIIVDDRFEPMKAEKEIGILASLTRTQSFSSLTRTVH